MRGLLLLAPLFLVAAACSSGAGTEQMIGDEGRGSTSSKVEGSCGLTRDQILASTSADRQNAISRGFAWLDANMPYSQSATSTDGYRTDCSGFVSMCWGLQTPGFTTADFASGGDGSSALGTYADLAPGDALVRRENGEGHIMMFLGWNDDAQTEACAIEEADTALDMQFGVHTVASLQSQGFSAIRNNAFGDTAPAATAPAATGDDDDTTGVVDPTGTVTTGASLPSPPPAPVKPGVVVSTPSGPVFFSPGGLPTSRTYGNCSSDATCNPGQSGSGLVCLGGQCVSGCVHSATCPSSMVCLGGQCQ